MAATERTRPNELPVKAPVKFEPAINLKAVWALQLDVYPLLLANGDGIIE